LLGLPSFGAAENAMSRSRVLARVVAALALVAGLGASASAAVLDVLQQRRNEANIRRLALHESCTMEEARRLYFLARRDGYGAAHRAVFGDGPRGGQIAARAEGPGAEAISGPPDHPTVLTPEPVSTTPS